MPLPTLAAQVTPAGISAPAYNDILNSLIEQMQAIFGSDIVLTPDTQDGQMLAIFAVAINDANQTIIAAYNGFAPTFSQGAMLSSLVKINGLQRQAGTNSTANLTLTGVVGTQIINGVVQDLNGNFWALPANVVIPISGAIIVTATCTTPGAIAAAANTINQISTIVLGWQTATNLLAAVPGTNPESDAALRERQSESTSISSITPPQAILAAVANVPGVTRFAIYENPTGVTDSNGVPPHSVALVVQGGNAASIAQAIELKKSPGTGTYGTTSKTVNDPAGLPITINFFQLVTVQIYVSLTIKAQPGFVASTVQAIQNSIVNFINSLPIGEAVFYTLIYGPASLYGGPLNQSFNITALTIGIAPAPVGTADIAVPFNEAAASQAANIVVTVT